MAKRIKRILELTKGDRRFIFLALSPIELIKLYQQSLFNILPSHDEGFGFSYVESSKFSCPSLLSDISVLRKFPVEKHFFDPNNPQEIADKIRKIYTDENLRNKIGADAKRSIFSSEKFKENFCLYYKSEDIKFFRFVVFR